MLQETEEKPPILQPLFNLKKQIVAPLLSHLL